MSISEVERTTRIIMDTWDWSNGRVVWNEAVIKSAVVDPLLRSLGWRTWFPWECLPYYHISGRDQSDYALFDRAGYVAGLINVMRQGSRTRYDRNRLSRICRRTGATVVVLTSGDWWEFYDPAIAAGDFNDRCVERLNLQRDTPENVAQFASALHQWISREELW